MQKQVYLNFGSLQWKLTRFWMKRFVCFFCWIVVLSISDSSFNNTAIMFYLLEVLSDRDMCLPLPRYPSVMRRLSSIWRISSGVKLIIPRVLSLISSLILILSLRIQFWRKHITWLMMRNLFWRRLLGKSLSTVSIAVCAFFLSI